ncbi:unnamed protein product [Rhodiola kirilowii]
MKAFLKSHDESVWEAVENGWTHPVTNEGTTKVKISRMEMVTSKFENLRMQEGE